MAGNSLISSMVTPYRGAGIGVVAATAVDVCAAKMGSELLREPTDVELPALPLLLPPPQSATSTLTEMAAASANAPNRATGRRGIDPDSVGRLMTGSVHSIAVMQQHHPDQNGSV
jgi:hypothetical protein